MKLANASCIDPRAASTELDLRKPHNPSENACFSKTNGQKKQRNRAKSYFQGNPRRCPGTPIGRNPKQKTRVSRRKSQFLEVMVTVLEVMVTVVEGIIAVLETARIAEEGFEPPTRGL
jgi:hypothetical protein